MLNYYFTFFCRLHSGKEKRVGWGKRQYVLLDCDESAQSAKTKSKRRKKGQAQMLREIFKAVLADFCRETGWAHYGTVWLARRTCHPQSLQLRSRLCVSHSSVNEQSPFGSRDHREQGHSLCSHVLLGKAKDVFLDSLRTQNNFKWHGKKYRIWRRTQRIKQQLLRITMLKK